MAKIEMEIVFILFSFFGKGVHFKMFGPTFFIFTNPSIVCTSILLICTEQILDLFPDVIHPPHIKGRVKTRR